MCQIIHVHNKNLAEIIFFTFRGKKTCKRNIKFGKVSGPQATSRGALPVRQYHKTH